MNKVVAFLEKYAEWLALGVASIFLIVVAWGNVLSPDHLRVEVAGEKVMPGDVDAVVQRGVTGLQSAMETGAGADIDRMLEVPDFTKQFQLAMGPDRPTMSKEVLASVHAVRPPQVNQSFEIKRLDGPGIDIQALPKMPDVAISGTSSGNSMISLPAPAAGAGVAGAGGGAADPNQPAAAANAGQAGGGNAQPANAVEKYWVTVEARVPLKQLAAEWRKAFYDPKTNQPFVGGLITHVLQVEVEREEQTGPDQWGNKTTVEPLALIEELPPYPSDDPNVSQEERIKEQETYRDWAERHLTEVGTPAFYQVTKGDPWQLPSAAAAAAAAEKAEAAKGGPGAGGPSAREMLGFGPETTTPQQKQGQLTDAEKQQAYKERQKQRQEKLKAEAAQRRAKTDAAGTSPGGSSSGGGRRIGGYAPLPVELAAGQGITDRTPAAPVRGGRPTTRPGGAPMPGGGAATPGGRPPAAAAPKSGSIFDAPPAAQKAAAVGTAADGKAVPAADGEPSPVLLGAAFDPTNPQQIPVDAKGNMPDGLVWAHDENVVPGKTYRYRVRVKLKNPLYHSHGLTKNPQLVEQLALVSNWTDWKEVRAPRSTEYFFSLIRKDLRTNQVTSASVDVFKRHKGDWMKATFNVVPGDGIGGTKGDVDFSTGWTLVDLRPLVGDDRDCRIMVSDESGVIDRLEFSAQVKDEFYKSLQEKARDPAQDAAGGPAANALPNRLN